ncbi:hypothetical protein BHM03_00021544 [Ensete ventricosum]|nr:hypothetical protein BHM03_00021544 [Ensete ventricosum]
MHCVVDWLGLFLRGFLFGFKAFFRWFAALIFHWFNHKEPALFATMFAAPRFVAMPTQSFGRSFVKLISCQFFWCGGSAAVEGAVGLGMAGRGKPFLEPLPRESSMGVFKPIEPLNSISLEVYGSDLHPCGIGGSIEPKIALRDEIHPIGSPSHPGKSTFMHGLLGSEVMCPCS